MIVNPVHWPNGARAACAITFDMGADSLVHILPQKKAMIAATPPDHGAHQASPANRVAADARRRLMRKQERDSGILETKAPPSDRQGLHAMLWTPEAVLLPNEIISHLAGPAQLFQRTSLNKTLASDGRSVGLETEKQLPQKISTPYPDQNQSGDAKLYITVSRATPPAKRKTPAIEQTVARDSFRDIQITGEASETTSLLLPGGGTTLRNVWQIRRIYRVDIHF